jgi:DNA-binding transcriptional regulator YiaG
MKDKKITTFVFQGFGFPITLVNAPMKKMLGEWVVDVDMTELQLVVLRALAYKPTRLTKDELRFIRKYLALTTTEFGKAFGVTHVSVLKWEKGQRVVTPSTELCIRLHVLNHLHVKDKEFRVLYNTITLEKLAKAKAEKFSSLEIDVSEELKIA